MVSQSNEVRYKNDLQWIDKSISQLMETAVQYNSNPKDRDRFLLSSQITFMELQQSCRVLASLSKSDKSLIQDEKLKMDSLLLSLQNYHYEIQHLNREIAKCDSYESIYENVDIRSEQEFKLMASPDLTGPDVSLHRLMLNRLEFELRERKDLSAQLDDLKKIRDEKLARNKSKRDDLESFDGQITAFVESSLPLQSFAGLTLTQDKSLIQKARCLPRPLYTLFRNITGYNQLIDDKLKIAILGDEDDAKKYNHKSSISTVNPQTKQESKSDSKDDEGDVIMDEKKLRTVNDAALYEKHPLSLTIIIKEIKDFAKLHFSYLAKLGIVVVKTEFLEHFDYFPPSFLTSSLFPGDTGLTSPNPSNELVFGRQFQFDFTKAEGFAYSWAQYVCGLLFPFPFPFTVSESGVWMDDPTSKESTPFLGYITNALLERRKELVQLNTIFARMCMGKLPLPEMEGLSELKTRISPFKREQKSALHKQVFYGQIEVDETSFQVEVHVPAAYPKESCSILLSKETSKTSTIPKPNNDETPQLRFPRHAEQIMKAVAKPRLDTTDSNKENRELDLMAWQMAKLLLCLRMYLNAEDESQPLELPL